MTVRVLRLVMPVLVLVAGAACTRAAYTGRFQSTFRSEDEEIAAADRAAAAYRQGVRPIDDAATLTRVDHVANAIVTAAKSGPAGDRARRLAWQVVVVTSPDTSVASFANGTIFVQAGLARRLTTDAALAGALGHAVARVLLRHGEEAASRRGTRNTLISMGDFGTSGSSRTELAEEQDEEADYVGCLLAVEAGYDADGVVEAFDRLGLKERGEQIRKRLPELRERSARNDATHP
jgi:predicted Zn-dependent protease